MFVEVRNRSYAATRNPAGNRKSQGGNSAATAVGETRSWAKAARWSVRRWIW